MTDYISFPSSGFFFFFGKITILVFIIINQQNSGNENLKRSFGDCFIETEPNTPRHLENKPLRASNFIRTFTLKSGTNRWKWRNMWRHKANVKDNEKKQNYKMEAIWYIKYNI